MGDFNRMQWEDDVFSAIEQRRWKSATSTGGKSTTTRPGATMLAVDDPHTIIDKAIELSGRRMFGPKHFAEAADVPFVRAQSILVELVAAGYMTALGNGQYKKRGVLDAPHKKATKKRSNTS